MSQALLGVERHYCYGLALGERNDGCIPSSLSPIHPVDVTSFFASLVRRWQKREPLAFCSDSAMPVNTSRNCVLEALRQRFINGAAVRFLFVHPPGCRVVAPLLRPIFQSSVGHSAARQGISPSVSTFALETIRIHPVLQQDALREANARSPHSQRKLWPPLRFCARSADRQRHYHCFQWPGSDLSNPDGPLHLSARTLEQSTDSAMTVARPRATAQPCR